MRFDANDFRTVVLIGCSLAGGLFCRAADSSMYVTNGLVVHFDGIENAGAGVHDASVRTWADLTGHGNDGTLGANVAWTADGWTNDADGYPVTVGWGIAAVTSTRLFSVEFACCPTTFDVRRNFVSQYNTNPSGHAFALEHNASNYKDGSLRLYGGDNLNVKSAVKIAANEESTVSVTWTPEEIAAWKNAERKTLHSVTAYSTLAADVNTVVGGDNTRPANAFRGTYHAFRLYDRVLSRSEIVRNTLLDAARFGTADVTVWNGTSGGSWMDATKWTYGVPCADMAGIVLGTAAQTIAIDSSVPTVTNLYVMGDGAATTVSVKAGGRLASSGGLLTIGPGGVFQIDGGTASFPDVCCATGVLDVADGTLCVGSALVSGEDGRATIRVGAGGRLETARADLTDAELVFTMDESAGGLLQVSGTATFGGNVTLTVDATACNRRQGFERRILTAAALAGELPGVRVIGGGRVTRDEKGYVYSFVPGMAIIFR